METWDNLFFHQEFLWSKYACTSILKRGLKTENDREDFRRFRFCSFYEANWPTKYCGIQRCLQGSLKCAPCDGTLCWWVTI